MALDSKNREQAISICEKQLEPLVTSGIANVAGQQTNSSSTSSLTISHTVVEVKTETDAAPSPVFLIREPSIADHSKCSDTVMASEDSASTSDLEKAVVPWEGYEKDVLPDKKQGKTVRNLRHQVFSLYRRLFGVVFLTNMAIFVAILVRGGANSQHLGLITLANLFVAMFVCFLMVCSLRLTVGVQSHEARLRGECIFQRLLRCSHIVRTF